uniref:Uncharacterized protein n=1 Tax=Arundo donax TaxID=35708 RepID=A0A0A9FF60_ARUDO
MGAVARAARTSRRADVAEGSD